MCVCSCSRARLSRLHAPPSLGCSRTPPLSLALPACSIISMEGYGTDAYLHLNRLGNVQEPLP